MNFGVKRKAFGILVVMVFFAGAVLVADCMAERTPASSVVKQSLSSGLLGQESTPQMKAFEKERRQAEKRWAEVKQFVGQQVLAANDKLAKSGVSDWWRRDLPSDMPLVKQKVAAKQSLAVSPMTLMVKIAGNLSAVQWWQASNQAAVMLEAGQQNVAQVSSKLQSDFQESLFHLVKFSSRSLVQQTSETAAVDFVQNMLAGDLEQLASDESLVAADAKEDSSPDPYWGYYSDCDLWGVDFNRSDEN